MSKYSSKGLVLERDVATVWTAVAQLTSVEGPGVEVQFFDGTALDSAVAIEDGELTGHATPGEFSLSGFYDPADTMHKAFVNNANAGGAYADFRVTYPDSGASVATFNGSVKSFTAKGEANAALTFDSLIKLRSMSSYPA